MKDRWQHVLTNFSHSVSGDVENPQLLRASRILLLIAVVAYPLFGITHHITNPSAVDPLTPRIAYAALCALMYALSYREPWVRAHINTVLIGLLYLLTSHFLLLLAWNQFSMDYVIGFFVIIFCLGVILISKRALICYCGYLIVGVGCACLYVGREATYASHLIGTVATLSVLSFVTLDYRIRVATALAQANQQLRKSEARYRLMAEYATDVIARHEPNGRIFYASPSSEALLGYVPEEVIGRFTQELFHPEDAPHLMAPYLDLAHAPETWTSTYRIRHKNGGYIWFETTNRAIRDAATGRVQEFLSISRDITSRKETEQLKDELVSTVSHELRTPLTSLRGFAELMLKREFPPDKQREFLTVIHSEALRLTNLINDFLDLQRIESGQQTYNFIALDLGELVQQSVTVFSGAQSPYTFRVNIPAGFPPARADKDRLHQVFTNLVSNAVKFSPNGGVITLGVREQDNEACIWVSDQGVGIPAKALPHLFNKFFRVDNQETRRIGGTGLGLALVKKIVEAHQGRIWVESTEGQGSTFFFTLPLAHAIIRDTVMIA
jgi:PAS domain S-box-containing protein